MGKATGRPVVFNQTRRELFLKAFAEGLPIVSCCAAAGGIDRMTYLDWVKVGEGRSGPHRELSEERRAAAVDFVRRLKEIEEAREAVLLEQCQKTLAQAATEGFVKVKIRKVTRFDGTGAQVYSETTEDVEKATPTWHAAAWAMERRQPETWGTGDARLAAAQARKLELEGGKPKTKEETTEMLRGILAQMPPDEVRALVADLLPMPIGTEDEDVASA